MNDKCKIDADDFKRMFRLEDKDLSEEFRDGLSAASTAYRPPTQAELEEYILDVLNTIHSDRKARSEDENQKAFESGWQENLELAKKEGISAEAKRIASWSAGRLNAYPLGTYFCPLKTGGRRAGFKLRAIFGETLKWRHNSVKGANPVNRIGLD